MTKKKSQQLPSAVKTGVLGKCPQCGEGKLFSGYLELADNCSKCGLKYDFADSADGPAVFIMLIVGFIVGGGAMVVEVLYQPPYWVHAIVWLPLGILMPLLMLRPLKGWWVNNQFVRNAREGKYTDL